MIMDKRCLKFFLILCMAIPFLTVTTACHKAPSGTEKTVKANSTWEVAGTTHLTALSIEPDAVVTAPEGFSLTMTVNHVETPIQPGTYTGDIVLTPTVNVPIKALLHGGTYNLRAALYVDNGAIVPEKSVRSAVDGGNVTDTSATDIHITSIGENFNGIITAGNTQYTLKNPTINFTGNGGNDFAGYGAALMSIGTSELTVNDASIITNGIIRTAVWGGGDSVLRINDSDIETGNPPLPEDYQDPFEKGGPVMMKVPFMLGMTGSCRATNLVQNATAYYTNTHIKAHGWGALSTDASQHVRLYATKCVIETVDSGYGAYAVGGSVDTFSGCAIDVADMAVCGTGGDCIFTDGTTVNSRRFGVMYHGSGNITIDKGSVFKTKSTVLQLKSPGHTIVVDDARLDTENGIILQTMANDDPNKQGGAAHSEAPGGPGSEMPEGAAPAAAAPDSGTSETNATFSNMTLHGDIINGNTAAETVNVTFKNVTFRGAITTATVRHALGPNGEKITMQTPELYYLIGEVTNTYCAKPDDPHGLNVSLDSKSKWIVDKTSYLTGLVLDEGAAVTALSGYRVIMTVDGKETIIKAGTYAGAIVLSVKPTEM